MGYRAYAASRFGFQEGWQFPCQTVNAGNKASPGQHKYHDYS
jgi:hypothetical protein